LSSVKKSTYHHGDLKNTLIEGAIRFLEKNGIAKLSLREIARFVGVSHNAPYRHFEDKDALIEAVAITGYNKITESNINAVKKYKKDPGKQIVEAGAQYILRAIKNPETHNLLFGGTIKHNTASVELKSVSLKAVQSLVQIIENGKKINLYNNRPGEELALTALCTVHGLSQFAISGHLKESALTDKEVRKFSKMITENLLQGILKR